MSELAELKDQC